MSTVKTNSILEDNVLMNVILILYIKKYLFLRDLFFYMELKLNNVIYILYFHFYYKMINLKVICLTRKNPKHV